MRIGKAERTFMVDSVFRNLGAKSPKVILGPGIGLDNAIMSAGSDHVLVVTTDPISFLPALGPKLSSWLSVNLIASDYTTSGHTPEFASFDINFPREIKEKVRESFIAGLSSACKEIGTAIVAGNTGSYPGAGLSVIGSGTMFGFAQNGTYVDPTMAEDGDAVLMTKSAALEATASLANSFPHTTKRNVGPYLFLKARTLTESCSTVKDAMTAACVGLGKGGVTSMHDATEGGVLGALDEMASASGKAFEVSVDDIPVSDEASAVCGVFGLNPLTSLSEGTLLITCRPTRLRDLEDRFKETGIPIRLIGSVREGRGLKLTMRGKRFNPPQSSSDRYWATYTAAARTGLR